MFGKCERCTSWRTGVKRIQLRELFQPKLCGHCREYVRKLILRQVYGERK